MGNIRQVVIKDEDQKIKYLNNSDTYKNILKIERPKYEVVEEKKELLTEEEREFLKKYKLFANYTIRLIRKHEKYLLFFDVTDKIRTKYEFFNCFKNLEEDLSYTLEELELEEN